MTAFCYFALYAELIYLDNLGAKKMKLSIAAQTYIFLLFCVYLKFKFNSVVSRSRHLFVCATVELHYVFNPISKSDWPTAVHLHSLACFDSARTLFAALFIP